MARRHIFSVILLSLVCSSVINGQDLLGGGISSFLPGLVENVALNKLGDMTHGFASEASGLTKNFGDFRDYWSNLQNFGKNALSPLSELPFGNLKLDNLPFGKLPLENLPFGKLPLDQLPLGNIFQKFTSPTTTEVESSGDTDAE